jgi:hypothetical protein
MAEADSDCTQDIIRALEDPGRTIEWVHRKLWLPVYRSLRHDYPVLSAHDLEDVWHDTLIKVFLQAREGSLARILEDARDGPLSTDEVVSVRVFRIARCRAIDLLRRITRHHDILIGHIGEALRDTSLGEQWGSLSPGDRGEILRRIHDAVETLPSKQRLVLQTYVEHYPESNNMKVLQANVSARTGQEETLDSIKRALQEGRVKIRKILCTFHEGFCR